MICGSSPTRCLLIPVGLWQGERSHSLTSATPHNALPESPSVPFGFVKDHRTVDDVLNRRAAKVRQQFEIPVMVAALAVLPVVIVEQVSVGRWATLFTEILNWLIWAAFTVEFAVVAFLTDDRRAYARKAWLDLLVIVVSFPLLGELFALTRLVRLSRLVRVLRLLRLASLAAVSARGLLLLRRLLRKRGLGYVTTAFVLIALTTGGLFALFEGHRVVDGLWWTVVTLTTVGYGDFSPVTMGGRVTAVVLMLAGIGVVSFITANIAAFFVESDQESDLANRLKSLEQRQERMEASLGQIQEHLSNVTQSPETDSTPENSGPSAEPSTQNDIPGS